MWEWSGNVESDALSNSRRTGNDVEVEEEEQEVLLDDAKREDMKEQGWRLINQ